MMYSIVLAIALLPVFILGWWIYRKDSARPEPLKLLFRAFLYGVGSTFVTVVIVSFLSMFGLVVREPGSFADAASLSLFGAALPEESAKLLMLWIFLRKNKYYDEYLDGIVYAACVGLGFAGAENILYVLQSEDWLLTGVIRGLTAVPAHFAMACAMGYFYSKRHWGDRSTLTAVCILAVPILIHWTWDALAFSEGVYPGLSVAIDIALLVLIYILYQRTMKRIASMQKLDEARFTPPPVPGTVAPPQSQTSGMPLPPPPPTQTTQTGTPLPPPFSGNNDNNNNPQV